MAKYYIFRGYVKKKQNRKINSIQKMQLFIKSIFILPEKFLETNFQTLA